MGAIFAAPVRNALDDRCLPAKTPESTRSSEKVGIGARGSSDDGARHAPGAQTQGSSIAGLPEIISPHRATRFMAAAPSTSAIFRDLRGVDVDPGLAYEAGQVES